MPTSVSRRRKILPCVSNWASVCLPPLPLLLTLLCLDCQKRDRVVMTAEVSSSSGGVTAAPVQPESAVVTAYLWHVSTRLTYSPQRLISTCAADERAPVLSRENLCASAALTANDAKLLLSRLRATSPAPSLSSGVGTRAVFVFGGLSKAEIWGLEFECDRVTDPDGHVRPIDCDTRVLLVSHLPGDSRRGAEEVPACRCKPAGPTSAYERGGATSEPEPVRRETGRRK